MTNTVKNFGKKLLVAGILLVSIAILVKNFLSFPILDLTLTFSVNLRTLLIVVIGVIAVPFIIAWCTEDE